jgi:hypothetical protein
MLARTGGRGAGAWRADVGQKMDRYFGLLGVGSGRAVLLICYTIVIDLDCGLRAHGRFAL